MSRIIAQHVNSENERITIQVATVGEFTGAYVLVLHDDDPPAGSGIGAPMLLDAGTRQWLRAQLDRFDAEGRCERCGHPMAAHDVMAHCNAPAK